MTGDLIHVSDDPLRVLFANMLMISRGEGKVDLLGTHLLSAYQALASRQDASNTGQAGINAQSVLNISSFLCDDTLAEQLASGSFGMVAAAMMANAEVFEQSIDELVDAIHPLQRQSLIDGCQLSMSTLTDVLFGSEGSKS